MMPKVQKKTLIILIFAMFFICSLSFADSQITLSKGQTIYIPVYSNVFSGDKALSFNLAAMLSIRNTDINNAMEINSVEYYDNEGILLKIYIEKTIVLGPLASKHIFIKESDEAGGFGANFIVRWEATKEINAPLVESVMIGARSGQGISFISEGQVITEKNK